MTGFNSMMLFLQVLKKQSSFHTAPLGQVWFLSGSLQGTGGTVTTDVEVVDIVYGVLTLVVSDDF